MTEIADDDDLLARFGQIADRMRLEAEQPIPNESQPDHNPKTVKRQPYTPPSGAVARTTKARNAYHRIQGKQGNR